MANEPMSDARLAELTTFINLVSRMIEEEWSVTGTFGDDGIGQALQDTEDIAKVLAENERLRAREAALLEIARAVATEDVLGYMGDAGEDVVCPFCNGAEDYTMPYRSDRSAYHEFRHDVDCIVVKARALLDSEAD